MENTAPSFDIVLPKGEADRPFHELNEDEVRDLGLKVFALVTERARKAGVVPITTKTVTRKNSK